MKNKYQVAFKRLKNDIERGNCDYNVEPYLNVLQELVDKETSKKPDNVKEFITFNGIAYKIAKCPNCKRNNKVREYVSKNRCHCCGQHLDWSDK